MTENKRFKKSLIEYKKSVQKLKTEKEQFEVDVRDFMRKKGLNVNVIYLGDKFGVVLNKNTENIFDNPPIPLDVLMEFCDTFDCEYEYMVRELRRYVFKFEGNLHMGS